MDVFTVVDGLQVLQVSGQREKSRPDEVDQILCECGTDIQKAE